MKIFMKKNKVIGLLPASGNAKRLGGIPKFLFLVNNNQNLLQWHIEKMSEVCDEIRVSTKSVWMPLVKELSLPDNVSYYEIEPSTMSDACKRMIDDDSKYLIGMPDTYISGSNNFYKNLANSDNDISISAFEYSKELFGKVGQVIFNEKNVLLDIRDKDKDCNWEYMWGAIAIKNIKIDETLQNPGMQIKKLIKTHEIAVMPESGKYIDLGTFEGIKEFYSIG